MSSPSLFFLVLGLLVLAIIIIGLLIDRRILTKKVLKTTVVDTATAVETEAKAVIKDMKVEVEKVFRPGELTIKSLQDDYDNLQAKIALAEKALLAELAGIQAQAQAAQDEAAQLSQLKAVLSATRVAPAPAPDLEVAPAQSP